MINMEQGLYDLAINLEDWPTHVYWGAWLPYRNGQEERDEFFGWPEDMPPKYHTAYTRDQWQAARQQLGLDQLEVTEAEEEAWQAKEREQSTKQLRYQDAKGEDWIDEFARTKSVDEFRGAMSFNIGKYNRRAGKKDEIIKEIEKMRDYCDRWIEYERSL